MCFQSECHSIDVATETPSLLKSWLFPRRTTLKCQAWGFQPCITAHDLLKRECYPQMLPFLSQARSGPSSRRQEAKGITRRRFILGLSASAAVATVLRGTWTAARAAAPPLPNSAVALNVIDVAGNLRLTQQSIETYRKSNPKLVDKIRFTQAPAPELPSKIKAQQEAGRLDIDLVLTGLDGLAAGIEQDLWLRLMPD